VASVTNEGGIYSFTYRNPPSRELSYLSDFVVADGRCRRRLPWLPGSSGFSSNHGGRDGDGYDEIFIVERAQLPRGVTLDLFADLETA
jgi:hypothetical protein